MAVLYLSIGTNLGDKEQHIRTAVNHIEELVGKVISRSALYVTEPWGFCSENSFINVAVGVETVLSPRNVLNATKEIERQMGRACKSSEGRYEDRIIDIDILLYDDWIVEEDDLIIPHPLMSQRLFVMQPLGEIAPELMHPVLRKSIKELLISIQQ